MMDYHQKNFMRNTLNNTYWFSSQAFIEHQQQCATYQIKSRKETSVQLTKCKDGSYNSITESTNL